MNTDTRTDDELNRIIAEWCGWKSFGKILLPGTPWSGVPPGEIKLREIPNYCRDLNAVHEAEKKLSREQFVDYCAFKLRYSTCEGCVEDYKMIVATSRQRAEALVKVIESTSK